MLANQEWVLAMLPPNSDLETKRVLKSLPSAHSALAELKGVAASIPNQSILINTLGLIEAKDSSEIENIITTHDELYKSGINSFGSIAAKEVQDYVAALKIGYELSGKTEILTNKTILTVQFTLERNNAGFRKLPGTVLKNSKTGDIVYTPPQEYDEIQNLMSNLEKFVNDNDMCSFDPLVKMAIIHYQFESIHPFYDGNGRTGRIINILYLIINELQKLPILYLSSYIIKNKARYYELLQDVRDNESWEEWLIFMIRGVEETAKETIDLIHQIRALMMEYKFQLRENYKFYSQDLLNNLFKHPYTKIEFIENDLGVSRVTASGYLNRLAKDGLLRKEKLGTGNYFINERLINLLSSR